ncbi:MAG: hypothetical protein ACPGVE_06480 [Flavobacteriales bacterium]
MANYLKNSEKTSTTTQSEKQFKKQEEEALEQYVTTHNLWVKHIDFSQYVSEGAEQKVYLKDSEHVLKLNDVLYFIDTVFYLKDSFWM